MRGEGFLTKILIFAFIATMIAMVYFYWQGADSSIVWKITTHAEPTTFAAHEFQKGPFSFAITGTYYALSESFSAGPIDRFLNRDAIFLMLTWLGIGLLLMLSTYLSRIWFTGVAGLFIFMLMNLEFSAIQIFGFDMFSYWGNIVLVILFIAPAYLFQSYFKYSHFGVRILTFLVASIIVLFLGDVDLIILQEQFNIGIYFSIIVLMLLFLIMISEENVFAILFLITKNRGGDNNEKHFSVFSLIYLVFLGMVYGKKAGFIRLELPFFDPYVLLIISSGVALWSLKKKKEVYDNILDDNQALQIFSAIGIIVFSYLALAFSRGNDPVFEGLHYFIIYAHLGFGLMFFLYTVINFVNPLAQGFQVHKIVYRERNFPYATARLAGVVIVTAFFLYSDQEAFKLFRAGHYNYLGEQAELSKENELADQYFMEASLYGHDNHFSSYKIGYKNLQKGKNKEANYQFERATLRYPTPQAFLNLSNTYGILNEVTPASVSLQSGLNRFPKNNALLNNLGLIYTDLNDFDQAECYFKQANESSSWNHANTVNLWLIGKGEQPTESYKEGNLAVKSNVLASAIKQNKTFECSFNKDFLLGTLPLHQSAFLINSLWYFHSEEVEKLLDESIQRPQNESIYQNSLHALAWFGYKNGELNLSMKRLDQLALQANQEDQAKYLNELGLMALEQMAPKLALDFFERAIANGYNEARLNKAIALLESKRFDDALNWMQKLAAQDSAIQTLSDDFSTILESNLVNEQQRGMKLYYQWDQFSPSEMITVLPSLNPEFIPQLWKKISFDLLVEDNYDLLEDYLSILKPYLQASDYQDCLAIIALTTNLSFSGDHIVAKALNSPDSLKGKRLFNIGNKNALDVPMVLATTKYLQDENTPLAYDILVEAIDLNPNQPALLKAYAMIALEMHLVDYADPIIEKLQQLISQEAFVEFQANFNTRKFELSESDEW